MLLPSAKIMAKNVGVRIYNRLEALPLAMSQTHLGDIPGSCRGVATMTS